MMVESLRRRLDGLFKLPIATPEDGRRVEQAARLLTTLLEVEQRVAELEADGKPVRPAKVGEQAPQYGADFGALSLHEASQRILAEAGFPMHVRDLAVRLIARGWRGRNGARPKPRPLADQLAARLSRHPQTFVRVRPNTFALVGMDPHATRPKPRLGIFDGPGGDFAANIGDVAEMFEEDPWRS